jgi:hypothetical protein
MSHGGELALACYTGRKFIRYRATDAMIEKLTAHTATQFPKAVILYMMQFSQTKKIFRSRERNAFQVPMKLKTSVTLVWTRESIIWEQKQLSAVQF